MNNAVENKDGGASCDSTRLQSKEFLILSIIETDDTESRLNEPHHHFRSNAMRGTCFVYLMETAFRTWKGLKNHWHAARRWGYGLWKTQIKIIFHTTNRVGKYLISEWLDSTSSNRKPQKCQNANRARSPKFRGSIFAEQQGKSWIAFGELSRILFQNCI